MLLFSATVVFTVCMLLQLARLASPRRFYWFAFLLLAWFSLIGTLAHRQAFNDFQRLPPLLALFILAAIIAASAFGIAVGRALPVAWLIGYQAFRIPLEIFLHQGFTNGFVPVQMTWEGRNWDVLTCLAALPIAWLASRNSLPLWAAHLWNLCGFALLLNIMTVSVLSLPTPMRQFQNEPANVFVTQFPYVWIPAVLVPVAWFGHIALFRRLKNS